MNRSDHEYQEIILVMKLKFDIQHFMEKIYEFRALSPKHLEGISKAPTASRQRISVT